MTESSSLLTVNGLIKSFKGRRVVHGTSLSMYSGEIVGLLGPNGAGKTTSFYMIIGLIAAEAGVVTLNGKNISNLSMAERAGLGLGYLPQEASIFKSLSVSDNIMAILELRQDLDKPQAKLELEKLIQDFSLNTVRDSLGSSLSGGERRRAEIARALASNPRFMLLDEPFAGVDPISVTEIKNIIRTLKQRDIGILITDHNVRETLDICERAYIVSNGGMLASGTPAEILANEQVRNSYLGSDFHL
jgi:lipopolysaccharide export system ATP-binding protein